MSTTSTTNCPCSTPYTGQSRKPKKLKASCDFCAMSKVKCDRGQPQCLRCIRNEVECHYSESRRIGKARRLYGASGHASKNPRASLQESWNQQSLQDRTDMRERQHAPDDGSESPEYSIAVDVFDQDSMVFVGDTDLTSDITTSPSQLDPSRKSTSTKSLDHHGASPDDIAFLTSQFPDFMQGICQERAPPLLEMEQKDQVDFQYLLSSDFMPPAEPRSCSNAGPTIRGEQDCMELACTAIQSLHLPVESCSLASVNAKQWDAMRSIDSTLKANRSARETMAQILACHCSSNWNLMFLLVLIARQLIDSYWALLKQQLSTSMELASASSVKDSSSRSSRETTSSVFDVTMTIGGYVLDGEARVKAITQVIRSQIEDMECLIDTLESQFTENTEDPMARCWTGLIESLRLCRERALQSSG
ncbi:hypothetical protein ACJ41O_011921 [Fusarium nematophilum]